MTGITNGPSPNPMAASTTPFGVAPLGIIHDDIAEWKEGWERRNAEYSWEPWDAVMAELPPRSAEPVGRKGVQSLSLTATNLASTFG